MILEFPAVIARLTFPMLVLALPAPAADRHHFSRPLMGTGFAVTCYADDAAFAERAANTAFAEGERINQIASDYLANSELNRLSTVGAGVPAPVSETLFDLLEASRSLARITGGRFDPTLGPLTTLWREARRTRSLPGPDELTAARSSSGWRNFTLNPRDRSITPLQCAMRFDLGGIAKGHAADRMLEIMMEYGISRTCIAAGGDVRFGDPPPAREGWNVALQPSGKMLTLANCAVSTSGDLHRFVEIDGIRYSHILDPATGLGITEPITVTVVAPTATLSDPLATAAVVAGSAKAEALARSCGATQVLIHNRTK